jgi:hypothetical protein
MLKRWGKMAERYQSRIDQQKTIIDRLMAAMAVYADLAYGVENEAKDVKTARRWAKEAQQKVEVILAVPTQEAKHDERTE